MVKFVFSKFVKRFVLSIINPRKAMEEIKDTPNLLPILILPLILAGLTFSRYYMLFHFKIKVPEPLYSSHLESFFNTMIWINTIYYVFYLLIGLLLVTFFFILGKWLGGSGYWVQGISAIGYVHTPNVLLMLLLVVVLFFSVPTVQTGLVNTIGQFSEESGNKRIIIELKGYAGIDSNISISLYSQYKIPQNATKGINNTIIGKTIISNGNVNISCSIRNEDRIRMINKIISLNNTIIDSNTPVILNNIVLNVSDNLNVKGIEKISLDLIILLNNTYVSPIPENSSIPYKMTVVLFYPDGVKTYEISSKFYPDIFQTPDPEPFLSVMKERISTIEYFLTIIAMIWQTLLLFILFRTIHEFTLYKTAVLIAVYIVVKFFIIGFTI